MLVLLCRTRTLTDPTILSFGGFTSRSRNLRLFFVGALLADSRGVGGRTSGSAASISSGNSAGRDLWPLSLITESGVSVSIVASEGMAGALAVGDNVGFLTGAFFLVILACIFSLRSCSLRLSFLLASCLFKIRWASHRQSIMNKGVPCTNFSCINGRSACLTKPVCCSNSLGFFVFA